MKTLSAYLLIILLMLAACKDSPGEQPGPEEPPSGPVRLLTMQKKYYDPLNAGKELYWTVYQNASENSITIVTDSIHDRYVRYFYDNEGRLQKILNNHPDLLFTIRDSSMVIRPSPGVIKKINYSGLETVYTTTPLAGGNKQIDVTFSTGDVSYLYIINSDGAIIKAIYTYPDLNGYESNRRRYFEYDGNKKLIGIRDTITELGGVAAQYTTIVKDEATNTVLQTLLKKIAGSDMEWTLFADPEQVHTPWFSRRIRDLHFIDKGTVLSYLLRRWYAPEGDYFTEYEPYAFNATTIYDSKGRITNNKLYEDGKLIETLDITYFD